MSSLRDFLSWILPARAMRAGDAFDSWISSKTGLQLTGAEQQQNDFNAQQAQIARDWSAQMDNTKYQRSVADMQAAGVNPALAMSNGVGAAPGASAASGSSDSKLASMSEIMSLILAKKQGNLLDAQSEQARKLGDAAIENAGTNKENAQSNRMNAETNALLANNQIRIGDSIISLNEAQMSSIAQQIKESESRISLQDIERLSKELDYQFDKDLFETNKALVCQQLVYRAVEMSEMRSVIALNNKLSENASKQGEILDADKVSSELTAEWKRIILNL